jgi:hypothetical protein
VITLRVGDITYCPCEEIPFIYGWETRGLPYDSNLWSLNYNSILRRWVRLDHSGNYSNLNLFGFYPFVTLDLVGTRTLTLQQAFIITQEKRVLPECDITFTSGVTYEVAYTHQESIPDLELRALRVVQRFERPFRPRRRDWQRAREGKGRKVLGG